MGVDVMTTTIAVDNDRGSRPMGVGVVTSTGSCCCVFTDGVLTGGGGATVEGRITTGVGFRSRPNRDPSSIIRSKTTNTPRQVTRVIRKKIIAR
jgi:hypothetical protein